MEKIIKSKLTFIIFISFIIGCSPKIEPNKFNNLRHAAKSIEGAISIGVSYPAYTELLQKFASELLIIKNDNMTSEELQLFNYYNEALDIFIDAQKIWAKKIEAPKYNWIPENNIFPLVGLTSIIGKYNIKIDEIKDSSGKKWSTISDKSIQLLWSKAELKILEADKLISKNKPKNLLDIIFPKSVSWGR